MSYDCLLSYHFISGHRRLISYTVERLYASLTRECITHNHSLVRSLTLPAAACENKFDIEHLLFARNSNTGKTIIRGG